MKIYIAQENETLEVIAAKFDIELLEVVRHNRSYRNRSNLGGCPILLPIEDEAPSESRLKVVRPFCSPKIEQLNDRMINYCHYLKEMLMSFFGAPKYVPVLEERLKDYKEDMKKILGDRLTKSKDNLLKAQEYSSLEADLLALAEAIKSQGLEKVKRALKDLQDWPKKIGALFAERSESFGDLLKQQADAWRDYLLSLAAREYKEAEKSFQQILHQLHDVEAKLLS